MDTSKLREEIHKYIDHAEQDLPEDGACYE